MGSFIKLGQSPEKYHGWMDYYRLPRGLYDSLPRPYEGQTVFVIGGGPSINHINLKLIADRPCVGCNSAYKLDPKGQWLDWLVFCDKRWFGWNHEELKLWPNREHVISLVPQLLERREDLWPWLKVVRRDEARFGLSVDQDTVCWNRGCGGAAINVAYLLGAIRIVLLGFDMKVVEGKHNWHDDHQKAERDKIYQNSMMPFLKPLGDSMKVTGLQIANATPGSALREFEMVPLEELLKRGW